MKGWKRFLFLVFSLVITLGFMGCSGKKSDHPTGDKTKSDHSEPEKKPKKAEHPKPDQPKKSEHPK